MMILIAVPLFAVSAHASEDFSKMSPTVKVTSYKKLFIDQVSAYGSGSGTVISPNGIIVTNNHVIFDEERFKPLDAFEVCITFDIQKEPVCKYTASLIANDMDKDVALLKINPKDVFGNTVPPLNYMDYSNSADPKEKTEVSVLGYPASGGRTITITKGQISGFDVFNGYKYFKTDTDFDHGSSGGTATDSEGNFIGIPTYLRTYSENVGYFLDLREITKWLDDNTKKTPTVDKKSMDILAGNLARLSKANDELSYSQDSYPFTKITPPAGWEFLEIDDDSYFLSQKNLSNPVSLSVNTVNYQFEISQGYMDRLDEEVAKIKETYPDYKKEEVIFAGQKAWKISYTSLYSKNAGYYIPYGYSIISLSYSIDLNEIDKQEKAVQQVLDSFEFIKTPSQNPGLKSTITFENPPFQISSAGDFRIQKNTDIQSDTLLAVAVQSENFDGNFAIYYENVPKDELKLSNKDRLDRVIKYFYNKKLVYKNDSVTLGGLTGYLYTYEYEGDKFQEKKKGMEVILRDGDYDLVLAYNDKTETFDANLPVIQTILDSLSFKGQNSSSVTPNSYGSLGFTFNDIQFHRYAQAIGDLAEKGIVKGYADGGFHPEQLVNRAEALKMVLESKNHLENKKGSKKSVDFSQYEPKKSVFKDVTSDYPMSKYINYAVDKKFAEGYKNGSFKPNQEVTLAEALKLIINAYEIPIWSGETDPWFKKYMDKGFELNLIPYGMYDPGKNLTRAELAYLISSVYSQADSNGFYY